MESKAAQSITSPDVSRTRPSCCILTCCDKKKRKQAPHSTDGDTHGCCPSGTKTPGVTDTPRLTRSRSKQLFARSTSQNLSGLSLEKDNGSDSRATVCGEKQDLPGLLNAGTLARTSSPLDDQPIQQIMIAMYCTNKPVTIPKSKQPLDPVRQALASLLPSQHDANVIFESSNGWMVLGAVYRPVKEYFVGKDPETYALDMAIVAQDRNIIIARTLLHLAVCISSLPPDFKISSLERIRDLDATMESYVSSVTSHITSSDELLLALPGIETLFLLASYQIYTSNYRKAWIVIERAMSLGRLMGLHRIVQQSQSIPPSKAVVSATNLWRNLVNAERNIGLLLRLPFATEDYLIDEMATAAQVHLARLAALCRQVSELDREITPDTYVQALALDEKLESIMKAQEKEFWDIPNVPPTARTSDSFALFERLIAQMWHFELKVLINLPYLLRAAKDQRYQYSRDAALQASRDILVRWFILHKVNMTQVYFRVAEICVFLAAVTVALDILADIANKPKLEVQKERGSDFAVICHVTAELEQIGNSNIRSHGGIASRSAKVLNNILATIDPRKRSTDKKRIVIPYFGIVELRFMDIPSRPAFQLDSKTRGKLHGMATKEHLLAFSFAKNDLWPPSTHSDGYDLGFDVTLFDGLQDVDLEGNWRF